MVFGMFSKIVLQEREPNNFRQRPSGLYFLTYSSERYLLRPQEEEVVALLHTSYDPSSIEVVGNGITQPLVISLTKLDPASVLLTEIFKCLHAQKML